MVKQTSTHRDPQVKPQSPGRRASASAPLATDLESTPAGRLGGADGTKHGGVRARIRMYRHGLGDCFLVFLPKAGGGFFKILVDCGVVLGTPNPVPLMQNVMSDILDVTQKQVDVLIATHEHWDHLSGFIQAADLFKQLAVGEVWLAWTEDPSDPLANKLKKEHDQALAALASVPEALAVAGDVTGASAIADLIGFFGEMGAAAGGNTTKAALDLVRGKVDASKIRYFKPDDAVHMEDPAVSLHVLGPPHDEKLIRKTLSPSETYGFAETFLAISAGDGAEMDAPPFDPIFCIPSDEARKMSFFASNYWASGPDSADWRRMGGASDLALALDNATNNTSFVLAIELSDGDVLLFVGDAQVGNWESWAQNELLNRAIFYKVGHHGSHNATLIAALQSMQRLKYAVVPVDHDMAVKKRWGNIPLPNLLDQIEQITSRNGGLTLRSDEDPAVLPPNITLKQLGSDRADLSYFDIEL